MKNLKIAKTMDVQEESMLNLDNSVDSIIENIKTMYSSLKIIKKRRLSEKDEKSINKIMNLLDTAISPYMVDIINEINKLESE